MRLTVFFADFVRDDHLAADFGPAAVHVIFSASFGVPGGGNLHISFQQETFRICRQPNIHLYVINTSLVSETRVA